MSLWEQMLEFGKSWFSFPELSAWQILAAVGVALAFGAIWLAAHWPPLFKNGWLWAAGVISAFLTLAAIIFIQIPLQHAVNLGLDAGWGAATIMDWILLAGVPMVIISGLVQESVKMVPVYFWWRRSGKSLTPLMGLAIGAVVGAGFGIFEAFSQIGGTITAGWTTAAIGTDGFIGISPFWERFFAVGFHISASALVGYGLAKGKPWKFLIIAILLHSVLNYSSIIFQHWFISTGGLGDYEHIIVQMETYIAVVAVLTTAAAMLLRWSGRFHGQDEEPGEDTETIEPLISATMDDTAAPSAQL